MKQSNITLFVMPGCQVCPQMERLFHSLHLKGAVNELQVIDVSKHPELARQHNIRSVPHYLINDVAFYGLKTPSEINQLLQQDDTNRWSELIKSELSEGLLAEVESNIQQHAAAREAMLFLLADAETNLVVRIGLTAVIETMAGTEMLKGYQQQFIELAGHADERVAIDAVYYLSLLGTAESLTKLVEISKTGTAVLKTQAAELLEELHG